jgi:DNA-binding response OmpR family regulator
MATKVHAVLVVDDDPHLAQLVAYALEDEGYAVEMAGDGQAALASVAQRMPDLIILDMKMPVMDGWAFAREFQSRYDYQAPILVFTAAEDARRRAQEIGAAGWIAKPFDLQRLIDEVARHLECYRKRVRA